MNKASAKNNRFYWLTRAAIRYRTSNPHSKLWPPLTTGISMIEILFAVAALAAVMIPIATTFSASNQGIQMTSEEMAAHAAGLELLEQTMAAPFALLPTGDFPDTALKNGRKLDPGQKSLILRISPVFDLQLTRDLKVTALTKDTRVRFKKVEVTISWTSRDKQHKRSITLKGLLANEEN
jgi:hypothetical protein